MKLPTFAMGFLVMLGACSPEATQDQVVAGQDAAPAETDARQAIAWFEGSVDEAFAVAKQTGKPLFLYWSAEWCPPCHVIKEAIFSKPEFIERSKLFVTVYLDGDDEDAQAYGERFGVYGYPTMIVFSPDGDEITRIPGGVDIQAYANILDLTLTAESPVRGLVEGLVNGAGSLRANDCSLLAYYSWDQDPDIRSDFELHDAFRRIYEACPVTLETERSIIYLAWLSEFEEADAGSDEGRVLTSDERAEALGALNSILGNPGIVRANLFPIILGGAKYASLLTEPGSEQREQLIARFEKVLDEIAVDESIHKRERIYTLLGKIRLERIDDESADLSEGLKQAVRDKALWADESTQSVYERQPVINAISNVLVVAGMDEVARPLLIAELEKSKQPYYFMTALADIEQRAGNYDAALGWLKSGHDSAKGPATRFQWGQYYLFGLLDMAPEDTRAIQDTTVALVTELLRDSGGFYNAPKARLKRMEARLLEWGADESEAVSNIRNSVQAVCATLSEPDEACETFLHSG